MAAAGNGHFGTFEGAGEIGAVVDGEGFLEGRVVVALFFFDVLGEIGHKAFERGFETRIGGFHVLEDFELFFDLDFEFQLSEGLLSCD